MLADKADTTKRIKMDSVIQLITLILIFAFVLAITYFATRWVANIQKTKQAGSNVKVIETMRISSSKYIQIVKIGNECFAIAVCKDTVTYLCPVKEEDLIIHNSFENKKTESFKAVFEKLKKDKPED